MPSRHFMTVDTAYSASDLTLTTWILEQTQIATTSSYLQLVPVNMYMYIT